MTFSQHISLDYHPFGMRMYERSSNSSLYRYGFNGKESDDEVKGEGNSYDFGARIYDSRIGRWLSTDPLANKTPWMSPYNYALNNPVYFIDSDGRIAWPVKKWKGVFWKIDDGFGDRSGKHKGLDINSKLGGSNDLGAPVYSTHDGIVVEVHLYSEHSNSAGSYVKIQAADGSFQTVYMHLETLKIKKGEVVKEGQQIGTVGGSGYKKKDAHTPHLHYEIRKKEGSNYTAIDPMEGGENGSPVDPQQWIESNDQLTKEQVEIFNNQLSYIRKRMMEIQEELSSDWFPDTEELNTELNYLIKKENEVKKTLENGNSNNG